VNVAVTIKTAYVAPVAGTANAINGTNGSVEYTITITKGNGAQAGTTQSIDKTVTVMATVYEAPTPIASPILGIWESTDSWDGFDIISNTEFLADGTMRYWSNQGMDVEQVTYVFADGILKMIYTFTDGDKTGVTEHTAEIHYSVAFSQNDTKMTITMTAQILDGEPYGDPEDGGATQFTKVSAPTVEPLTLAQFIEYRIQQLKNQLFHTFFESDYSPENWQLVLNIINGIDETSVTYNPDYQNIEWGGSNALYGIPKLGSGAVQSGIIGIWSIEMEGFLNESEFRANGEMYTIAENSNGAVESTFTYTYTDGWLVIHLSNTDIYYIVELSANDTVLAMTKANEDGSIMYHDDEPQTFVFTRISAFTLEIE
jgi:antitoxin component YwqK of YwqJK toxin-antitoxin module